MCQKSLQVSKDEIAKCLIKTEWKKCKYIPLISLGGCHFTHLSFKTPWWGGEEEMPTIGGDFTAVHPLSEGEYLCFNSFW